MRPPELLRAAASPASVATRPGASPEEGAAASGGVDVKGGWRFLGTPRGARAVCLETGGPGWGAPRSGGGRWCCGGDKEGPLRDVEGVAGQVNPRLGHRRPTGLVGPDVAVLGREVWGEELDAPRLFFWEGPVQRPAVGLLCYCNFF